MDDMTVKEMRTAYAWGRNTMKELIEKGETIPEWMYRRLIELADAIMMEMEV